MSTEERKHARELYDACRKDLLARQISNSERYDGAILSLSTASLGISLAFIKDIVPIEQLNLLPVLVTSWALFAMSVVSTVVSFIIGQKAIDTQLIHAEEYYLNGKDEFLTKRNPHAGFTEKLNTGSGVLFIVALLLTIVFVSVNLYGAKDMSERKDGTSHALDGAVVPKMQTTNSPGRIEKSAPIPSMQPVPPQGGGQQPSTPPPQSDGKK